MSVQNELLLKYKDTDAYININKLMVRLGLANVNYIYNNVSGNTKLIQSLLDLSEEFKINKLNVDNGEVEINGYLNELKYVNTSPGSTNGFWSKIFK